MSGPGRGAERVTLTPAHLIRAGTGLDAYRLQARGSGLLLSSLGLFRVRGALDALVYRRVRAPRLRALFIGLHGLAWASVELPTAGRAQAPAIHLLRPPPPPALKPLPSFGVQLTVTPPEPP